MATTTRQPEELLYDWSAPPGVTEREKCENAESAIRKAITANPTCNNTTMDEDCKVWGEVNPDNRSVKLIYSYMSIPNPAVRRRREIHRGTIELDCPKSEKNRLKGSYWTDRRTTGEAKLAFFSKVVGSLLVSYTNETMRNSPNTDEEPRITHFHKHKIWGVR